MVSCGMCYDGGSSATWPGAMALLGFHVNDCHPDKMDNALGG